MSTLPRLEPKPVVRTLVFDPPLTDEEFEDLCAHNEMRFERRKDGVLVMNPPTGPDTGDGNSEINYQLRGWWAAHGRRGRVFDSSTGFYLPDGSMKCPDASYATAEQATTVITHKGRRIAEGCPAFVIELRSESDDLKQLERKMDDWMANGAELAWLVDPHERRVVVYQLGARPLAFVGHSISGTGPVAGFAMNLDAIWRCYE